jgi:hypothetical protein
MINEYKFGKIKIDGRDYENDVQVASGQVGKWQRAESHYFTTDELEDLIEQGICQGEWPKTIVIGNGHDGVMKIDPAIERRLAEKGIDLVINKTGLAKEEFNKLLAENNNVLGLFHLTC